MGILFAHCCRGRPFLVDTNFWVWTSFQSLKHKPRTTVCPVFFRGFRTVTGLFCSLVDELWRGDGEKINFHGSGS